MGQFSAEKPVLPGSVLSGNQQIHLTLLSLRSDFGPNRPPQFHVHSGSPNVAVLGKGAQRNAKQRPNVGRRVPPPSARREECLHALPDVATK
jgi:hypothetical protein